MWPSMPKKGSGRQRGACYNCGKPGHRKADCWADGGGKADQKPKWLLEKEKWEKERREGKGDEEPEPSDKGKAKGKAKESATTAMIDEDFAWMAYAGHAFISEDDDDVVSTISSE